MFVLNFSYKDFDGGDANIIIYIDGMTAHFIIIAAIAVYILVDYDILSIKANLFSLNEYVRNYLYKGFIFYGFRNYYLP